jgi:hypothetical protein
MNGALNVNVRALRGRHTRLTCNSQINSALVEFQINHKGHYLERFELTVLPFQQISKMLGLSHKTEL